MNKYLIAAIALVFILVIYLALNHHNEAPTHAQVEAQATPEVTSTSAPTPTASPENVDNTFGPEVEIKFSKELIVTAQTLSIDGGAPRAFTCASEDSEAPTYFGFFTLVDGTRVDISCIAGSEGTVDLRYPTQNGETLRYVLASAGSDEGSTWDLRSFLTVDPQNSVITIRSITLGNQEDSVEGYDSDCQYAEKITMWNTELRDFTEATAGQEFNILEFAPPINVAQGCLNPDGTWKKK